MNVKINNTLYEDVQWFGNVLTMETEMSLAEAEAAFAPGTNANIVVYDGETEIAKYINKGIESLSVSAEPRTLTVVFTVTQFTDDAKEEIQESLDTSDGAIAELAELVAEMSEKQETYDGYGEHIDTLVNTVQVLGEGVNTALGHFENQQAVIQSLTPAVENMKDTQIPDILARLRALEERIGE